MKMSEFCYFFEKSYDNKQSRNVILTENIDWEIKKSNNNKLKAVINGQPLFSLRNNGPDNNGRL